MWKWAQTGILDVIIVGLLDHSKEMWKTFPCLSQPLIYIIDGIKPLWLWALWCKSWCRPTIWTLWPISRVVRGVRNHINQSKGASLCLSGSWAVPFVQWAKGLLRWWKSLAAELPSWKHSVPRKLIVRCWDHSSSRQLVTWNVVCNNPEPWNGTAVILEKSWWSMRSTEKRLSQPKLQTSRDWSGEEWQQ